MWAYEFTYKKRMLFVGLHHDAWPKPSQAGVPGEMVRHKTSAVSRRAREVLADRPPATWCVAFWPNQEPEVWSLDAPANGKRVRQEAVPTAAASDRQTRARRAPAKAQVLPVPPRDDRVRDIGDLRQRTMAKWRLSRAVDEELRRRMESLRTAGGRLTLHLERIEDLATAIADGLQMEQFGLLRIWRRLGTRIVPAEVTMELTHAGWRWLEESD
jgi:hypothetical protein